MCFRIGQPWVRCEPIQEPVIRAQIAIQLSDCRAPAVEQDKRVLARLRQDQMILMRTQIAVAHQFRDTNLQVHGTAQLLVMGPFSEAGIIGRCCGQRDEADILKPRREFIQTRPPFPSQMVCFVQDQCHRSTIVQSLDQRINRLGTPQTVERLIGRQREFAHVRQIAGDRSGIGHRVEEQRAKTLGPLLTNRDCRREHECRPAYAAHDLQTKDSLACAGRGNDVEPPIGEMFVHLLKNTRLIIAPGPFEFHGLKHVAVLSF